MKWTSSLLSPHLHPFSDTFSTCGQTTQDDFKKEGENKYTLTFQLSTHLLNCNKLTCFSKKDFSPIADSADCWVRSEDHRGDDVSLTPCRGKHGSRLSLRSRSVCTQAIPTERNEGGCRGTTWHKDWSFGGPQNPGKISQSKNKSKRRRRLSAHRTINDSATALTRRPMWTPSLKVPYSTVFHQFHTAVKGPKTLFNMYCPKHIPGPAFQLSKSRSAELYSEHSVSVPAPLNANELHLSTPTWGALPAMSLSGRWSPLC